MATAPRHVAAGLRSRLRTAATALALLGAAVATGCGLGAGPSAEGEARLTVTRGFGDETLLEATISDPDRSETVTRFLDREAEIETSYGGNFVDGIEGLRGGSSGGRRSDWFFYINGYWSPVGAAEARVRPGDEIWWDYRQWEAAYRVPAVVGSWPQPFASGFGGERFPTVVECESSSGVCDEVSERLRSAGAELVEEGGVSEPEAVLRVLVGTWQALEGDRAVRLLMEGPGASGVYAIPRADRDGWRLAALDRRGREQAELGAGGGLVAAVRLGERQPTWLVAGNDESGLRAAVDLLDRDALADRYAVIADPRTAVTSVPVTTAPEDRPGDDG